jgi:arylsulfatase A-like enzyme
VTSDHGRGRTVDDWYSHGKDFQGAEQIWVAIVGPDTQAVGEAVNVPEIFQRDIAPTMLDLMGVDYREYAGVLGQPIAAAILLN